jgi:hypothetical protein
MNTSDQQSATQGRCWPESVRPKSWGSIPWKAGRIRLLHGMRLEFPVVGNNAV